MRKLSSMILIAFIWGVLGLCYLTCFGVTDKLIPSLEDGFITKEEYNITP